MTIRTHPIDWPTTGPADGHMALFKSNEERRIRREMKIRQGIGGSSGPSGEQGKFMTTSWLTPPRPSIGDKSSTVLSHSLKKTAVIRKSSNGSCWQFKNACSSSGRLRPARISAGDGVDAARSEAVRRVTTCTHAGRWEKPWCIADHGRAYEHCFSIRSGHCRFMMRR